MQVSGMLRPHSQMFYLAGKSSKDKWSSLLWLVIIAKNKSFITLPLGGDNSQPLQNFPDWKHQHQPDPGTTFTELLTKTIRFKYWLWCLSFKRLSRTIATPLMIMIQVHWQRFFSKLSVTVALFNLLALATLGNTTLIRSIVQWTWKLKQISVLGRVFYLKLICFVQECNFKV